jgi:predicted O-methyltransferase YrrM
MKGVGKRAMHSRQPHLRDEGTFRQAFSENLRSCRWEPHRLYSVFTQYDQEYYLREKEAFLHKYRCFYAVSKTIAPRRIIELGTSAGSSADAYLSGAPGAEYVGIDVFGKARHHVNGSVWDPYVIAQRLFAERGFTNYRLIRADLRTLSRLPASADLVVVDASHDFENEYADLNLALTARPTFIFIDDSDDEQGAAPAIRHFLEVDVRDRVAYRVPIQYVGGGLVISLLQDASSRIKTALPVGERRKGTRIDHTEKRAARHSVLDNRIKSRRDEAERRARELIDVGPDASAPTRNRPIARVISRIVLFLLRPYDRHQRMIHEAILDVMRARREEGGAASKRPDGL